MKTPRYRYFFTDIMTGQLKGSLPLDDVSIQNALSTPGSFRANLFGGSRRLNRLRDVAGVTEPRRTCYWVDRDDALFSGGILWDRSFNKKGRTWQFTGATFDSYVDHRIILQDLDYTAGGVLGTDIVQVACDLWHRALAAEGGDIGVNVPAPGSVLAGQLEKLVYKRASRQFIGPAINQLAQSSPGFDYVPRVQYDGAMRPTSSIVFGDPYVGRTMSETNLVFRNPGNVDTYEWPEYGSRSPTSSLGLGGGTGDNALLTSYVDESMLAAGYPLLEDTVTYKDIFDQDLLNSVTREHNASVTKGVVTPTLYLRPGDTSYALDEYGPGDACRVVIEPDERFPYGLDGYYRITSVNVSPQRNKQPEGVSLTIGPPVR